jgi:hypothetical protein
MDFSHTNAPPKHEKEDDESSVYLTIFDTEDDKSSDLDNCCHYIKKLSTSFEVVYDTSTGTATRAACCGSF